MRVIVVAAELSSIVAKTSAHVDTRWGTRWLRADEAGLLSVGAERAWVDGLLRLGTRFAVASEAGQIIGWNAYLVGPRVRQFNWLELRLNEGRDLVSVGAFVVPERRGQRVMAAINHFAAAEFSRAGYTRMLSCVERDNRSALAMHRHFGANALARLTRLRLGPLGVISEGWRVRRCGRVRGLRLELSL